MFYSINSASEKISSENNAVYTHENIILIFMYITMFIFAYVYVFIRYDNAITLFLSFNEYICKYFRFIHGITQKKSRTNADFY